MVVVVVVEDPEEEQEEEHGSNILIVCVQEKFSAGAGVWGHCPQYLLFCNIIIVTLLYGMFCACMHVKSYEQPHVSYHVSWHSLFVCVF